MGDAKAAQNVTPWGVKDVDYDRIVNEFGCTPINTALIERVERVTGKPAHPWLRRGLFFAHRALDEMLNAIEAGEPFYIYTGRGPSSDSLHLGHMIPFMFAKYLQDAFGAPLVIQLTDDEKFLWKDMSLEDARHFARENARDIIAVGFDPARTFIFVDTDYIGRMYPNVVKIQRCVTASQVKAIFGFDGADNIGKYAYPAVQAAPSFSSSFPDLFGLDADARCLIPCAIDQDPFFRMTRDVAPRIGYRKPAVVHSKFFPALQGPNTKMSASVPASAIFMSDEPAVVRDKIVKHAFSGGRATLSEHRRLGGDCSVDVPYQYLSIFCFDDARLARIHDDYSSGRMLTGEIKEELIDVITPLLADHQRARAAVTDDVVDAFFSRRPIELRGRTAVTADAP